MLSFPPLRITVSICYFVEIISLNVNTSFVQRKHLIMGLIEICNILGCVELLFPSSKYYLFFYLRPKFSTIHSQTSVAI